MVPKEITHREFNDISWALWRKAAVYAQLEEKFLSCYFSTADIPCNYTEKIPKTFHLRTQPNTKTIHFTPVSCCSGQLKMNKDIEVICLCRTEKDEQTKFYLTTHAVGKCPWKLPTSKNKKEKRR